MYDNQSLKSDVFGCPFCKTIKQITEAVDVDFNQMMPQWNKKTVMMGGVSVDVPTNGPPDFYRREKTPMLICENCAP